VANYIRAAFRVVVARPVLILAEIAWRWAFGAAACALVFFAFHRIFAHTDVSQLELLLSRHSDLFLIADACARILAQVLPQLAAEAIVLVPAIAVLWIVAATVGRVVTLNALVGSASRAYVRVLLLHILRAALTIAVGLAFCGAVLFVGATLALQHPAAAVALSLVLMMLVASCWSVVNWFVALALIWVVRDGLGVFAAIGASIELYRRSPGAYVGIASWFGVVRAVAIVVATIVALIAAQASPSSAVAASIAIALAYFAVADFCYIARLAAYVELHGSSQLSVTNSQPAALGPHVAAIIPDSPVSPTADS
jgi:hypothetical protein